MPAGRKQQIRGTLVLSSSLGSHPECVCSLRPDIPTVKAEAPTTLYAIDWRLGDDDPALVSVQAVPYGLHEWRILDAKSGEALHFRSAYAYRSRIHKAHAAYTPRDAWQRFETLCETERLDAQSRIEAFTRMGDLARAAIDATCRTCGAVYAGYGDGYDGECPTCADKTERELHEAAGDAL